MRGDGDLDRALRRRPKPRFELDRGPSGRPVAARPIPSGRAADLDAEALERGDDPLVGVLGRGEKHPFAGRLGTLPARRRDRLEPRPTRRILAFRTIPHVEGSFDLLAASLRADTRDLRSFVEALATKLEGAFPERVRVERGNRFAGRRVRSIGVELGDDRYELEHDDGRIACRRRNVVRGIALKNEELELDRWIDALSGGLVDEAERSDRGRQALERLLGA